jgi:lipoic acid synthetase
LTSPPLSTPRRAAKPAWLKVKFPSEAAAFSVAAVLDSRKLHTICRSAKCPNIGECWSQRTATFLILGDVCSRACAFCAVAKGVPAPPEPDEPRAVADAAAALGLAYAVVTSVTRDDLPDGGASQFVATIRALRERIAGLRVEVLVPDFGGDAETLRTVVSAAPDILNHNLETVEALYPRIGRPQANYRRSLDVLRRAKEWGAMTKSGLMIGLGETEDDLLGAVRDLRDAGCDLLTIGQYLQPTRAHAPVAKYYPPEEFERLRRTALDLGFAGVEAGPLVRSSFHAHELYDILGDSSRTTTTCAT